MRRRHDRIDKAAALRYTQYPAGLLELETYTYVASHTLRLRSSDGAAAHQYLCMQACDRGWMGRECGNESQRRDLLRVQPLLRRCRTRLKELTEVLSLVDVRRAGESRFISVERPR